jgi:uncharacterized membrane protein YhaH (DUF805 family)
MRISSGAAVLLLVVSVGIGMVFNKSSQPTTLTTAGDANVISFEPPCTAGLHYSALVGFSTLIWFASFLVLAVQGLRNHSAPRWLASISLITFVVTFRSALWVKLNCGTQPSLVAFCLWASAVVVMCLHQISQSNIQDRKARSIVRGS